MNEITQKRDDVKNELERLRRRRLDEFMQGFNTISQKLKEMYQVFEETTYLVVNLSVC